MDFFIWLQLALVCILGAMSPGPSLAVIIRNSITYSRSAGIYTSIGHGFGMSIYATIAVVGLGIIIRSYTHFFIFIQIIGSIFLAGLGLLFILKSEEKNKSEKLSINSNSFFQGFMIALLNPKILIWFTAIFSQFIQINATYLEKMILVSTAAIIDAIWYSIVSVLVTGYGFKKLLDSNKSFINKLMGILLIIISLILLYRLFSS
jgi:threonine/homoserine/homoserine lactone efflux protein